VFAALGLGLALPYLAASLWPAVARALPRPGAWMDTFRRFMAFPMFATVVWLVWVLGQQSGIDGAGALLILLVGLACWPGRWPCKAAHGAGWAAWPRWPWPAAVGLWPPCHAHGRGGGSPSQRHGHRRTRLAALGPRRCRGRLVASGRPVFVDFTAAWCVTCQYNKKTTLANAEVLADLHAKNVALLRADWTRRDPAITAALAQLGRNGVPVYVNRCAPRPTWPNWPCPTWTSCATCSTPSPASARRSMAACRLIGFSGSPWTLACYMVEGKGSDDYRLVKTLMYSRPDLMHRILAVNADAVAQYLNAQIDAGAQAVMIFDSWGGVLADGAFQEFSLAYTRRVLAQLKRTGVDGRTCRASSSPRAAASGSKT
jgi:thiol-disulfide isomerase/thioredoxin